MDADRLLELAAELGRERTQAGVLQRVVHVAREVVSGAENVSVTLVANGRLVTAAANGPFGERVDALQYEVGEGPCVTAARAGRVVLVSDLAGDARWPRLGARWRQLPVHSVLAVPLLNGRVTRGSINLAAVARNAFAPPGRASGVAFGAVAALALAAAEDRERAERERTQAAAVVDALGNELRSGLTAVLAAAEVVQRRAARLDARGRQALDLLMSGLAHQRRQVVDLFAGSSWSTLTGVDPLGAAAELGECGELAAEEPNGTVAGNGANTGR